MKPPENIYLPDSEDMLFNWYKLKKEVETDVEYIRADLREGYIKKLHLKLRHLEALIETSRDVIKGIECE